MYAYIGISKNNANCLYSSSPQLWRPWTLPLQTPPPQVPPPPGLKPSPHQAPPRPKRCRPVRRLPRNPRRSSHCLRNRWKSIRPDGMVRYIPHGHGVDSQHRCHHRSSHRIRSPGRRVPTNIFAAPISRSHSPHSARPLLCP